MSHPDPKATPPVELSAKYMAWNIKQIDETLKKIASLMERMVENNKKGTPRAVEQDLPF